jgi:hypothetical protein
LTYADISALYLGPNDLVALARVSADLTRNEFLRAIFNNWTTTEAAPTQLSTRPARLATDTTIPFGTFTEPAYNKDQRATMKRTNRSAQELGFVPLPNRSPGALVYIKVVALRFGARFEFVDSQQRFLNSDQVDNLPGRTYNQCITAALLNYDRKDWDNCKRCNKEFLVYLARQRFWAWYVSQGPIRWNDAIFHHIIPEDLFLPEKPLRTAAAIFGATLAAKVIQTAQAGLYDITDTPNGFRPDGTPYELRREDQARQYPGPDVEGDDRL